MKPSGILFDCDGVLVDSEVIACRVDAEVLAACGYTVTPEIIAARFLGVSAASMIATLATESGIAPPPDLQERRVSAVRAAFEKELRPIQGVRDAVLAIKAAGIPIAVASSSTPDRIDFSLRIAGLHDLFGQHIYSASMVKRGKPAPDLFLLAAARLGLSAVTCLVIEDAEPGVIGARAADITVFGFVGGSHCGPDHGAGLKRVGADQVFDSMSDLARLAGLN